ncbi:probable crinkler effector protein 8 [Coccomyxa sp. Obi]|nr:probable crinkler effector protein 8 [Coccomyxa sp. Obi]
MEAVLSSLGINCDIAGNVVDTSAATTPTKRPDSLLFLQSTLMLKGEMKESVKNFTQAETELLTKTSKWSLALHGTREYILCFAAAGHKLRFNAVARGGGSMKAISPVFDLRSPIDRLKVMHTSIKVLTIALQQIHQQLPEVARRVGSTHRMKHSLITYHEDYVEKAVDLPHFVNHDLDSLLNVHRLLCDLPNGESIDHPAGLVRPLELPGRDGDMWIVRVPLGVQRMPSCMCLLRGLVMDILYGLAMLHSRGFVHRNIQWDNIVEMSPTRYVLISFEHSGLADTVPPFLPLLHWAPESRHSRAPYTTAADMYSVGASMANSRLKLGKQAGDLCAQLMNGDPAKRPSASEARLHPWLCD